MSQGIKNSSLRLVDMTSGPILTNLIKFILPLMATNLLIELYQAADIVVVGFSSEPDAIGATGAVASFLSLVTTLYLGFSVGATVLVSRSIGEKDSEKVSRAVHTSIALALASGVIGGIIGILLSHPVVVLLGNEGKILTLAVTYARIRFLFMPFASLQKFLTAILNAYGDTKTSLFVLGFTGLLNVLLNVFFVFVCGLSVEGVAIATGISNIVASVLLWVKISRDNTHCKASLHKIKFSKAELVEIIKIGFPSGLQSAMFSISNLIIQSSVVSVNNALTPVGSAYAPVLKGNTAAGSIESIIITSLGALTTASTTFVARLCGAGDYQRIKKFFLTLVTTSVIISVLVGGVCILLRNPLLSLFDVTRGEDILSTLAYETATKRIFIKWTTFIPFVIMNVSTGGIRGLGKSSLAAIITLVGTCLFRIVWIYTVFKSISTLEIIYLSYPISWVLTGIASLALFIFVYKRKSKMNEIKTNTGTP